MFMNDMPCRSRKEVLLANPDNKQRFLYTLRGKMEDKSQKVSHADGADALTVQAVLRCSKDDKTVVFGGDTDSLVLLCYRANLSFHNPFFYE